MLIESTDTAPDAADTITVSRAEYESLRARLAALEQQLAALKRQRFGASSENADQLTMFGSADIELIEQEIKAEVPVAPKKTVVERQRLVLPKGLPEERVEVDLPACEKVAADGAPLKRIGEEVTVKLCFKPAAFFKKLIIRPKYADPRQPEAGVRCAKVSIRRNPFWRKPQSMLKSVDPHGSSEDIDGGASAFGFVGVVHADIGGVGEWPERCCVLPVAGVAVCHVHGLAGSTEP
jgi:hypothetical protein